MLNDEIILSVQWLHFSVTANCLGSLGRSWRVTGLVFSWWHLFLREISRRWCWGPVLSITLPAYIFHTIKSSRSKHCDFKRISLAPLTKASYINFKQYTTKNNVSSIIFYANGCSVSSVVDIIFSFSFSLLNSFVSC